MKRILSTLVLAAMLLCMALSLTSCGGPSGSYRDALGVTTIEFDGGKATITVLGGFSYTASYEMGEDEKGYETITFSYGDGERENDTFKGTLPYTEGVEGESEYIKIAGIKYTKID